MAAKAPVKQLPRPKEMVFLWEGKDRNGNILKGDMRAPGEAVVKVTLRRQGITVLRVKKQTFRSGGKISEKDLALFTRQLATMMKAGVPLLQAFDIVGKGHSNPAMARMLQEIKSDVETGTSLSVAFRKYPTYFDGLFCNLIAAGEQAGILDDLLDRLAIYKEKTLAIKGKIKKALFYPISIIVVAIAIVTVIMLFVIPAFKSVFASFGASLPLPTLIVIAVSDFFVKYWYFLLGGVAGAIYAVLQTWKRSPEFRIWIDRVMLRLPLFGPLLRKAAIARWTRTLSTMFAAGVPLVEALDSVGGAAGNFVYLEATKKVQMDVTTGLSLTSSMTTVGVFPTMVTQMVAIGEESGALDSMLAKVADFYEREVDETVDALASLMEPLIMVVLGVVIGGLVVSLYLPIFKLGAVI